MSRIIDSIADTREQIGSKNRSVLGMLRRMVVSVTSGTIWQVVGLTLLDGITKETQPVEVFSGIGFYSRPSPGANTEAIVGHVGGRENPAIIALRDEDTRRKIAKIEQNETAMYNTLAILLVDKDGHMHARFPNGTTKRLAFVDDLNALRGFVAAQFSGAGHVHAAPGGPTTSTVPVGAPPSTSYDGTEVLRSQ